MKREERKDVQKRGRDKSVEKEDRDKKQSSVSTFCLCRNSWGVNGHSLLQIILSTNMKNTNEKPSFYGKVKNVLGRAQSYKLTCWVYLAHFDCNLESSDFLLFPDLKFVTGKFFE